ncbi:TonB-dependent hemoglobin/transferrin/lactoferrin family receptor [Sinorhizobium psoraleae]|uniref:TonB-dependent hemoglobin/transferrin/lactoferrin family receptor n=1 Tax=Sinorhizobium psoraleae TaxID=520838 RepID=A0ABT4KIZ5_9HYPH|nr:TonB-dependent hemoglobin/transferrin/lactoferrin family receptor [Sinorhizobium psoraleae]MCZ4091946.1 TonB-dependent hemoglobin/transferrin/lactoferrin family receptor [Sinorhizobium psoraleae]
MLNRHHRLALLACTAFVTLAGAAISHAQSITSNETAAAEKQGRVTPLKTLTVRTGEQEGVADTPLASQVTEQELDDNQISSFEDLGRTLEPGVYFNRENGSVNIRGLDGPRVLTLIDGIAIPYLDDGARDADGGIDSFDFSELSTVDIVRGADSSRAGGGALGGAVVLRTLDPEDLIGEGRIWGGIFKFAYDGEDESLGGSAAVAARYDNTAVLFQGGYKKGHERQTGGDNGAYGTGRTEANPADFDQNNVLVKVKQYTDSGHGFTLTGERFDRDEDTDLRHAQTGATYRPGEWDGTEVNKRDRISLNYEFEATDDDALFDAANAVFYWQDLIRESGTHGVRYATPAGDYQRLSEVEDRGFGSAGYVEKGFDAGYFHHTVTLGGDFYINTTTQYSSGKDSCGPGPYPPFSSCNFLHSNQSDMPDVESKRFGIFVQDEIAFGETGFSLTPGLRYDWYEHSPQETAAYSRNPNYNGLPDGQDGDALSPKLLAKHQATDNIELFAQWAMAFRAPTATELYLDYGAPGTYLRLGNPDLKPETSSGVEIGANLGDTDFGGRITGFYNRYRNFIDSVDAPVQDPINYPFGVTQYMNRNRVQISGVELAAHKIFDSGVTLRGSVTYALGKDLDTNERLGSVAPLKGVLAVGYETETWGTELAMIAAKDVSEKSDASFKAPGYGIFDLTGWWKPGQVEGLTMRAGIYNLFDKEYYDAISVRDVTLTSTGPGRAFYSEPGRTFKFSLTQRF